MEYGVTLATACVLGFIHALEVDHMLAVAAFVSRRPTLSTAARFGLRWGLGHSVAVLLIGAILLATGLRWSERYDRLGEGLIGVMLMAIGLWAIRSTRNLHIHLPSEHGNHAHLHVHPQGQARHRHPHGPGGHSHPHPAPGTLHSPPSTLNPTRTPHPITLVGMLHGLAGTTAVVALVPVTLLDRFAVGVGYLIAFGVGVTSAMTVFATVTAAAIRRTSVRSLAWGRRITVAVGVAGVLIGAWWLWAALAAEGTLP